MRHRFNFPAPLVSLSGNLDALGGLPAPRFSDTSRPPRIYKGVKYWNCDDLSEEEMERIHSCPGHHEYCECGFQMGAKAGGPTGIYFKCRDCGFERPFSGKRNLES